MPGFSSEIRANKNFAAALKIWNKSPTFRSLLARGGVVVQLGSGIGTHTQKSATSAVITISRAEFLDALKTDDPVQLARFGARISHEFAHALLSGGTPSVTDIPRPSIYVPREIHGEAVAFAAEYLIGRELGIPSSMTTGMSSLIPTLDQYYASNNGATAGFYRQAYSFIQGQVPNNFNPSDAPNLTYAQYQKYSYALAVAGVDTGRVNWTTVSDANFSVTNTSNGWSFSATGIGTTGGSINSISGTITYGAKGLVTGQFSENITSGGRTTSLSSRRYGAGNGIRTPQTGYSDPWQPATPIGVSDVDASGNVLVSYSDGSFRQFHVQPSQGEQEYAQFAQLFGSTLGRLLGDGNLVIGTLAGSVLSAAALSIGQSLFHVGYYPNGSVVGVNTTGSGSVWGDFENNLSQFGVNAGIGAASSYLAAEFAQSLGLNGAAGDVFSFASGNVLQFVATQVATGQTIDAALSSVGTKAFGEAFKANVGAFIGQELASLIVQPHTVAESTLASVGSAVGAFIGAKEAIVGATLAGPVGAAIGAFIGYVLGDLLGSLFGHHKPRIPSASAETVLQLPFAHYSLGNEASANGGDLGLADAMAKSARDTLNGIIAEIVGTSSPSFVANGYSPTQTYGVTGSQIYVKLGGAQNNVTSADQAVDKGVLWALPQTQIIGGDLILKRAVHNANAVSVTALLGDLQIASDYRDYLKNQGAIDAAISLSYNALSADDKAFYAANKAFITRAISAAALPLQGADVNFYNANRGQVDRIVNSLSVSSFAAGWIVTLSRAAELGLDNFTASDFFGGLQGFLQSFGVARADGLVAYEDITASLSGGTLSLHANGPSGQGLFVGVPGSSTDGATMSVAAFASRVGYVEQGIGYRSTASDVEIAAPGSGGVTVYAGQPGYYGGYYGSYPGNDGGSDIIIGAGGNDYLAAGSGGDWLDGQGGDDQIYGGAGNDVLLGGDGNDQVIGGGGRQYLAGGNGDDYLDGGGAADVLVGGAGSDTLHGGDGDDVLLADEDGGTFDLLDGGNGNDTVSFERFASGVTADISAQGPSNLLTKQQAGFTLYRDQAIYSPDGRYRFVFQSDQNLVLYGPGNAVLWASNTRNGGGYRVVLNADGNLIMYKSNGSIKWQSYSGGHSGAVLTLDNAGQLNIDDQDGTAYWTIGGGGYVAPVVSSIYGDQWQSIENITGSNYDDHLIGTNNGGTLKGLGGDDVLIGGSGDDVIEGGVGADQIDGGGGSNTASYAASRQSVFVDLGRGSTDNGDAAGDTLTNIQNLSGSNLADGLAGDDNANVIKAGGGDDWISGGKGYDTYDGGDGFDTVDYTAATFVTGTSTFEYGGIPYTYNSPALMVTMSDYGSTASYLDRDGTSGLHNLVSIEQVIGTSSDDSFYGAGTTLNVTWNGGAGNDTFTGGDGSDTYVFGHHFGVYSISDTSAASNTLQLTSDVTFDDLWVANAGGTLQVGIRGESGYMSVASNFANGNDVIKTLDMGGAGQVDLTQISAVYGGSDAGEGISADSSTANLIFAYNGDDTIYAANGTYSYQGSVVYAGLGNDTIVTSVGDDQFLFERGNGHDYVMDGGGQNTIVFGSTVSEDDIIYEVVGNDLIIGIKDINNPGLRASQVADTVQIVGGAVKNVGTTYGTSYWNTSFSVQAGGATTDLTKANIAWAINYYDDSYQGGGGYGGYGGWYGGGYIPPIVLDLQGDGLEITPVAQSDIVTKDAAGNVLRTSWVGPTNGILAYDRNGDGRVDNTADISFRGDRKGAKTDLEGLGAWDSNGDGTLDARDDGFAKLVVWTDANQNGRQEEGEVVSLLSAGVASISLAGKPTGFDGKDNTDTIVHNTTSFLRSDGSSGTAYDVALARRALGDVTASSILGVKGLDGPASFGLLESGSPSRSSVQGLLASSASGTIDARIDAAAVAAWANVLDPATRAARKALLAGGMRGADLVQTIRTTLAHGDDWFSLFGRGTRTAATRLQAVVIDLDRTGADLIDPTDSGVLADVSHSGMAARIGWVKASDGVLAFDADGNGSIDVATEVDFTGKVANAKTAFQGLGAFDENRDGVLDAADSSFAKFLVWRDRNGDGASGKGELQTLTQAGVSKLDLSGSSSRRAFGGAESNEVLGVGKATMTDGSSRATYDVALGFADGDDAGDTAPTRTPAAKTGVVSASGDRTGSSVGDDEAAVGSATARPSSTTLSDVGRARGSTGQNGQVVTGDAPASGASSWWRDSSAAGGEPASLTSFGMLGGSDDGTHGASMTRAPMGDAAQMQRLLLLRQNMAAVGGVAGGSAAVWTRGGGEEMSLAAATANSYALPSAVASTRAA